MATPLMEGLQSTWPKVTPCAQSTLAGHEKPLRHSSTTSPLETTTFTGMLLMITTIIVMMQALSVDYLWRLATWVTHRWANSPGVCVCDGNCEVNAYLTMKAFDHWDESFLSFRKKLAKSLINNPYYVREMKETRRLRGTRGSWTRQIQHWCL